MAIILVYSGLIFGPSFFAGICAQLALSYSARRNKMESYYQRSIRLQQAYDDNDDSSQPVDSVNPLSAIHQPQTRVKHEIHGNQLTLVQVSCYVSAWKRVCQGLHFHCYICL